MTIAEMVYIRNERDHAAAVLHWFKTEGYIFGDKDSTDALICKWENLLQFWKDELLI